MFDRRSLTSGGVGTPVYKFEGHTAAVLYVQWSPDKSSVFGSSAEDGLLNVWDHEKFNVQRLAFEEGQFVKTLEEANDAIFKLLNKGKVHKLQATVVTLKSQMETLESRLQAVERFMTSESDKSPSATGSGGDDSP